jgi:hypothetical protein
MTATFVLPDAFFGGRQHNDADFRIAMGNATLYVDSVTVTNLSLPPVVGPDPSESVAAFYYAWYRSADMDGEWVHWQETNFQPPSDISSDFYPQLGAYSSVDPITVAQHFAWLRESGVGLIISSWWGQASPTDQAAPLLLELGSIYDVKVAFHIEPYAERSADRLLEDVRYLYARYGEHPSFYRMPASSPWIQGDRPQGLFFLFGPGFAGEAEPEVPAEYWRETIDAIHALPDGGIVIAATTDCSWVDRAHFDGLYNYITPHLGEQNAFNWSRCVRRGAWYVPSVIPGNSPRRIGYPQDLYEPRREGATYDAQWEAALATGVRPQMVTVTSFNEWHEGTQIEPARYGMESGRGYTYDDYGPLGEQGYLTLTRQWADRFRRMEWPALPGMRVHITTTADWTSLLLLSGGTWIQPGMISTSEEATMASISDNRINLNQTLDRARAREQVELLMDVSMSDVEPGGMLTFEIQRGSIGWTKVELFDLSGPEPTLVATRTWGGITGSDGLNPHRFELPAASLVGEPVP